MTEETSQRLKRWRRERMLDELHGLPRGCVPSDEVLGHVRGLHELGFSRWAITSAAGLRAKSTSFLDSDTRPGTYLRHARRFLALTPQLTFERAAGPSQVPSFAAVRRYQALQWLGHTQAVIEAAAVQGTGNHAWCSMLKPGERVSAARHRAMAAAFDELNTVPGLSAKTSTMARTRGFLPPIAWDDLDDPNEDPRLVSGGADIMDVIAVERVIAGEGWAPLSSSEVNAAIALGIRSGLKYREIADLLRMRHDAVTQRVTRYGLNAGSMKSGVAA